MNQIRLASLIGSATLDLTAEEATEVRAYGAYGSMLRTLREEQNVPSVESHVDLDSFDLGGRKTSRAAYDSRRRVLTEAEIEAIEQQVACL